MNRVFYLLLSFLLISFIFSLSSLPAYGQEAPPANVVEETLAQREVDTLKAQVEKLRDENYQNAMTASKNASDKADSFIGALGLIATIAGVAFSAIGIGFTVVAIIIAVGIFSIRKELKEELQELRTHVETTKKNAEEVRHFADEAQKKVEEELPKLIKDIQENQKAWGEFMTSAKNEKDKQSKEITGKLQEFQEKNNELTNKLLQNVNTISGLNSQATVASGYYPARIVGGGGGGGGFGGNAFGAAGFGGRSMGGGGGGGGVATPWDDVPACTICGRPFTSEPNDPITNVCYSCRRGGV